MLDKKLLITSLKAACSLTLAASIVFYFHYKVFWWAITVGFLAIQPEVGSSIMAFLARFIGTYIGCIIGIILSLTYQFPWVYYPLIILFVFFSAYYMLQPNFSWGGLFCLLAGLLSLLVGPSYPEGVVYYAIERCLQVTFVAVVICFILLIWQAESAQMLLRKKLQKTLEKYEALWKLIIKFYLIKDNAASCKIKTLIQSISSDLVRLNLLLLFARHEIWKKNFNTGQCLELLRTMKRILSILVAINETTQYLTHEENKDKVQNLKLYLKNIDHYITQSLRAIKKTVDVPPTNHFQLDKDIESLDQLMNKKLLTYFDENINKGYINLHRVAWFSLINRLFHVLMLAQKVGVSITSKQKKPDVNKILAKEMHWLRGVALKQLDIYSLRWKTSLHLALTCGCLILAQQYFSWSPMFTVFGSITALFAAMSIRIPIASNLGLGLLGIISGSLYAYCALYVLSYYPQLMLVLFFLFLGTSFAAYLLLMSKIHFKQYLVFSLYFVIMMVYSLSSEPTTHDFSFQLIAGISALFGTITFVIISRTVFPCDYKKMLRHALYTLLLHEAKTLRHLGSNHLTEINLHHLQSEFFYQTQRIEHARQCIQYCIDQECYTQGQADQLENFVVQSELMLLADLSTIHPYTALNQHQALQAFRSHTQNERKKMISNLLNYAKNIKYPNVNHPVLNNFDKLKKTVDIKIQHLIKQLKNNEPNKDLVLQLRALALLYSGFNRTLDLHKNLFAFKKMTV